MLTKNSITDIVIHSDDWFAGRLAKLTSSECHFLCGDKDITEAGRRYVYRKVGEELTGKPCRNEISTEATEHGHLYEPEAILKFGQHMQLDFLVTQKLIVPPDSRQGSTPDAIWVVKESEDKTAYNVRTVEVKCPPSFDNYICLWNCNSPADVKRVEKKYYWQVMHQMYVCQALDGYLVVYHPHFRAGQMNIIHFRKLNLLPEFKLLDARLKEAELVFDQQRSLMINSNIKLTQV
jgi:hypothetical protein